MPDIQEIYEKYTNRRGDSGFRVREGTMDAEYEVVIFPAIYDADGIRCEHSKNNILPISLFVSDGSGYHGVYVCMECVLELYDHLLKNGYVQPSSNKINKIKEL